MSKYSADEFLRACGATGPLYLTVEQAGAGGRPVLQQPSALVGRNPRADIRLYAGPIARRHAYLQLLGGRLLCIALVGRPNGPRGRYPRNNWLGPGQTL